MERWSIDVQKDYLRFSAAHFLIYPDGHAERLHGHNYKVYVEVAAALSPHGLVMDFQRIKPLIRELVDELDERWIVPGQHPELRVAPAGANLEVRYRERVYSAPVEDVLVLPINNSSAENLAAYVGRRARVLIAERFPEVRVERLRLAVEETPGQRGIYEFVA